MGGCTVTFTPEGRSATVAPGDTILKAAEAAGVFVNSICGGDGLCGKCRVVVREGSVSSRPTALLDRDEIRAGYVLACETQVLGDLVVGIPEESRLTGRTAFTAEETLRFGKASSQRGGVKEYAFAPLSRKLFLALPAPSLDDNLGDLERVYREIAALAPSPVMQTGLFNIRSLSKLLRENDFRITATIGRRGKTTEVVQFEPGETAGKNYGVALDIGTTTVVAGLVNLATGETASQKATYNSQIQYGEDVITRIVHTVEEPDGLAKLHDTVVKDINNLIGAMVEESGINHHDITYVVAAGNTTMTHLLLGLEVANIRREPYIPGANFVPVVRAAEAGVAVNGRGLLCTLPGAGPYVGSDVTADIVACSMHEHPALSLLVDLGTNGEVVLGNVDWLMCCSASAGPAFEGGGLRCGIRATEGAIERVAINAFGRFSCKVIGKARPRGICGSGLIDLAAELFRAGAIDRAGRFVRDGSDWGGPVPGLRDGDQGPEMVIVPAAETATGRDITVSEDDLAIFIRSKGAIYTAAQALLVRMGLDFTDVQRVFVSGGFGSYIDVSNAVLIGLFPDLPVERFQFIGNGSLIGARMCLLSEGALADAEAVAGRMTYVDLSTDATFMNEFTSSLFLPHTAVEKFPSVMQTLDAARARTVSLRERAAAAGRGGEAAADDNSERSTA
jgi:uncharacterized 2Fe-2S/4Fe-4S cluster protein (DUF4445 family)